MKKLFAVTAIALGLAMSAKVLAHGAKATHGGIVQSAGDLAFELVSKDGKAVIYVHDHGTDLATEGATGTLTVLAGGKKTHVALAPGGANTLASASAVALAKGTKVLASITLPGKQPLNVRFAQK